MSGLTLLYGLPRKRKRFPRDDAIVASLGCGYGGRIDKVGAELSVREVFKSDSASLVVERYLDPYRTQKNRS